MVDLTKYAWVSEHNGISYYRHIDNPKDEIQVKDGKKTKMSKKLRLHLKDVRLKNPKKNRSVK